MDFNAPTFLIVLLVLVLISSKSLRRLIMILAILGIYILYTQNKMNIIPDMARKYIQKADNYIDSFLKSVEKNEKISKIMQKKDSK